MKNIATWNFILEEDLFWKDHFKSVALEKVTNSSYGLIQESSEINSSWCYIGLLLDTGKPFN